MKGIGFKNMKVFKGYQWFDFRNITLLTGTNNSGKSSIINAMQMLQENLPGKGIDNLIRKDFKVKTNQHKFGSIESFINNEPSDQGKFFVFSRKVNNIIYRVRVNVEEGLESKGRVDIIKAIDAKTDQEIFVLKVNNSYPQYECLLRINFRYFVNRYNEKCRNTELLFKRKIELDQLADLVNKGKKNKEEFTNFANQVSSEVGVYIAELKGYHNVKRDKHKRKFGLTYSFESENIFVDNRQKIEEVRVFFTKNKKENRLEFRGLISEKEYEDIFAPAYRNGIFDFSLLWKDDPVSKIEFESLLTSFYKCESEQSYNMLSDDLVDTLSNHYWGMKDLRYDEDPLFVPSAMTKAFIKSIADFGLLGSMLEVPVKDSSEKKSLVLDKYVEAHYTRNTKSDSNLKLENSGFYAGIFGRLSNVIMQKLNELKSKNSNFEIRRSDNFMDTNAQNEILSEILTVVCDFNLSFNNHYVSSSRFVTKRSYSFNDRTDFTDYLGQVENLPTKQKKTCLDFINEWLKKFEIADELLLKSDPDTGNFKAYMKKNDIETILADFGLGTNQLLPIIFSLGIHRYGFVSNVYDEEIIPRTVVIEEPEANLHPAMQSKLADLFIDAIKKFKVQIIAETHSEYLIRKLQYLTAKGEFSPNDTAIYYFHNPKEIPDGEEQVKRIEIHEDGSLSSDFGPGFFDEALNWKFELMKLKNLN